MSYYWGNKKNSMTQVQKCVIKSCGWFLLIFHQNTQVFSVDLLFKIFRVWSCYDSPQQSSKLKPSGPGGLRYNTIKYKLFTGRFIQSGILYWSINKCVFRRKPGWLFARWAQQRGQLWLCHLVFFGTQSVFNIRSLFGCWQNTFSVGTLTKFLRMQFRCVNVDERWE